MSDWCINGQAFCLIHALSLALGAWLGWLLGRYSHYETKRYVDGKKVNKTAF